MKKNEEVDLLLDDEMTKAEAKPKNPKRQKPASVQKQAVKKGDAGFGKGLAAGMLAMVFVLGLVIPVLYFNVGGAATRAISVLHLDKEADRIQQERSDELERLTASLEMEKSALEQGVTELTRDKASLAARELDVKKKEEAAASLIASVESRKAELAQVVAIYESLDPAQAASVLVALEDEEMLVVILKNMSQGRVSQILGKMDPQAAARMLALLATGTNNGQSA